MKHLSIFFSLILLVFLVACGNLPQVAVDTPATMEPAIPSEATAVMVTATAAPTQPPVEPTQPAAPAETQPSGLNGEEFDVALANAIEARDYAAMRSMMSTYFPVGYWLSEGVQFSVDEAVAQLESNFLPAGSSPDVSFEKDLSALLGGADPLMLFGPNSNAVRAFHIDGMGPNGQDEAIALIARDPDSGRYYWAGMLFAMGGFQPVGNGDPLGDLSAQLGNAIESRDFNALRGLMKDRFSFATFNTQLIEVTAEEAIEKLRDGSLAEGSQPVVRWSADVPALLGGTDPLSLWGPVAQTIRAVHVSGLGPNANQEAVLVIGRDPATGKLYFHGVLEPQFDVFRPGDSDLDVLPTDVKYVMALDTINARSGPGTNYASEGQLREGEVAQVTGKSIDNNWWRIMCTQDASGYCWISADPSLTQPTTAP